MAETETIRWYVSKPTVSVCYLDTVLSVLYLCLSPEYCALQQHLLLLLITIGAGTVWAVAHTDF